MASSAAVSVTSASATSILNPQARNAPIASSAAAARIDHLIEAREKRRETIVIPTPALSEVLVHADEAGPEYLEILNTTRCFRDRTV